MLTAEQVRLLLNYDAKTGTFLWRANRTGSAKSGAVAGKIDDVGNGRCYLKIRVNGIRYLAHRLAWLYVHGDWPRDQIDHIDGNSLNNKLSNLRLATRSENMCNRGATKTNAIGFKGVNWNTTKQKYQSRIKNQGQQIHLGYFTTAEEAHNAYVVAARRYHGEFARTE